ncbi:MAG TPA: hypothetical protein VGZ02_03270 [Candidatus Baltobacteraceae bacterium]|jgi:membrane protein implicated in regulation of membrane protease activity|nr:hypothetical protein [Candidatus Baltobacteraceae bacterium]
MLRIFVTVLGVALIAGAAAVAIGLPQIWPLGAQLFVLGALVLVGLVFERHYRGRVAAPSARLQKTGERFIDPVSGKLTEVLYDPSTGERVYRQV